MKNKSIALKLNLVCGDRHRLDHRLSEILDDCWESSQPEWKRCRVIRHWCSTDAKFISISRTDRIIPPGTSCWNRMPACDSFWFIIALFHLGMPCLSSVAPSTRLVALPQYKVKWSSSSWYKSLKSLKKRRCFKWICHLYVYATCGHACEDVPVFLHLTSPKLGWNSWSHEINYRERKLRITWGNATCRKSSHSLVSWLSL